MNLNHIDRQVVWQGEGRIRRRVLERVSKRRLGQHGQPRLPHLPAERRQADRTVDYGQTAHHAPANGHAASYGPADAGITAILVATQSCHDGTHGGYRRLMDRPYDLRGDGQQRAQHRGR